MMPNNIKIMVAKIDLIENLLIPQMPCPDVQPLPILVPNPTKKPPKIINIKEFVISKVPEDSLNKKYIKGPNIKPNKNKKFENLFNLFVTEFAKIPLIPANLPVV